MISRRRVPSRRSSEDRSAVNRPKMLASKRVSIAPALLGECQELRDVVVRR
jgi:hypothetical protein